MTFLYLH